MARVACQYENDPVAQDTGEHRASPAKPVG